METKEAILKRRSIRKYLDKEVDNDTITLLLKSAMAAPSAINRRPWEFYVVKDKETLSLLRKSSPYTNIESPLIIVVCGNTLRGVSAILPDFWVQDCSAATENILLTATDLGLGSCWNGVYPLKIVMKKVSKILSLPFNIVPLSIIHIGYKNEEKEERTQYDEKRVHNINERSK